MVATLNTGPVSITLTWENPGNANLLILRRTKGQAGNVWQQVINLAGSNLTSLTDNGVATGQVYEYVIQRTINNLNAFGYAHVAVNGNPVNTRGKILIFVDSTTADALGVELIRLKNDMRGDGWWPIAFHTGPSSTVQSVKNQIVTSYNADPNNVKAVLLLGSVPIPYSGDAAWDGHSPDHLGAWPCDAFYADVNGVWTDTSVNNVLPNRLANDNIPGDGKFDQNFIPTPVELQVGRVDFRRINAAAFGAADQNGLMKRYLDKNHNFRIGNYVVENKALIDDNFGYFGGEAFAANGFRNAYPLVGEANIISTDFFMGTESQSYLLGYGCGGGNYNGAGGVGNSTNFATDSINIVFSNLFGSYFGDWDYESDPFMPSALASRGGILNCSWAGRPHWFNQALASGETIGYCTKETMNANTNNGFFGSFGESGAHVALLGDPTIRAHVVKPATALTVTAPDCKTVVLNWTASADLVAGYHIYRAPSQDGPYTRLTTNPVTATTYTDNSPALDTLYYQVRAIKNVSSPGGGTYANNAIGPIQSIVFTGAGGPTVTATGGSLTCANLNLVLTATPSAPVINWSWIGPNNFSSSLQNPTVTNTGTYTVTGTDAAGCSSSATAVVNGDFSAPTITATVSNTINCANANATITVDPAGLSTCTISGPGGFFVLGFSATVTIAGAYTLTATSATNGCIGNTTVNVLADQDIPSISVVNSITLTCTNLFAVLTASSNTPGATFTWTGPCLGPGNVAGCPGVYTVIVTNPANGCTNSASTTVGVDVIQPSVSAQGGVITCNDPSVPLTATVGANTVIQWTGPCVVPGLPAMASCAGQYTVIATNTNNGCTNSAVAVVTEDTQAPNISLPPLPAITCVLSCIDFTVPNLPGFEIYIAGQLAPPGLVYPICQPGSVPVSIKSLSNGCTQDIVLTIEMDITPPVADAGPDQTLSCNAPSVVLDGSGSSTGPNFTYLWVGPGINSPQISTTVNVAGTYTLLVTNTQNGCTSSDQVIVTADQSLPTVNASVSGNLTCVTSTVVLSSGNNDPNVLYSWTGPNNFTSNLSNPTVSAPGLYTVIVSVGTCSATDAVEVTFINTLTANINPALIDCDATFELCATASGGAAPYSYLWSNGTTTACANYTAPATVGVVIADAGGCVFESPLITIVEPPTETLVTTVTHETAPNASNGTIDLTVTGGIGGYLYLWSTGATTQDLTGLTGGTYTCTVTNVNGCTSMITVLVLTTSGANEAAIFEQFQLSPNPTEGLSMLSLKLFQTATIRLEIRDMAGRLVLENASKVADTLLEPIDLSQNPAGIYTVSVWIDNQVFVRKLAVVR